MAVVVAVAVIVVCLAVFVVASVVVAVVVVVVVRCCCRRCCRRCPRRARLSAWAEVFLPSSFVSNSRTAIFCVSFVVGLCNEWFVQIGVLGFLLTMYY